MIKKYNQFVNERVNEGVENFEEVDTNQQEGDLSNNDIGGFDNEETEVKSISEEEMEEEGGDVYASKLKQLADKLGTEVTNGRIEYNGKKIMFPSETEMFHVGNKKFKTDEEVIAFLEGDSEKPNMKESGIIESKSYKHTRKFK